MNTKRFILLTTLITALLMAPFTIAGLLLPAQYRDTFLGEFPEKCKRLKDAPGKRLIVVGGSGMAFAIDSALIKDYLPDYSVVNMGMYAGLGTKIPLEIVKADLHSGDIVLIAPEPQPQALSLYTGGRAALQAMDGSWSLLKCLPREDLGAVLAYLPDFSLDKWRNVFSGERPEGEGIYRRASFNAYGDIESDLAGANVMPELYDPTMPVSFDPDIIQTEYMEYLNRFAKAAEGKGAEVYFCFCPANRLAVNDSNSVSQYYDYLSDHLTFPLIGNPENSVMDELWFFDTNFHLNQSGRIAYTRQLIRDLKAWRADASVTDIEIPPQPSPAPFAEAVTLKKSQYSGNRNVADIEIPIEVTAIEDYAFEGCSSLQTIRLLQRLPSRVIIGNHLLDGTSARIIVPRGTLSAYRTDYRFSRYADRIYEADGP